MDNCTISRREDRIILTIYIGEYVIVYTIMHNHIIYTMDDITIDYVRKYEWTIEDLRCKSQTIQHGLLSTLANVRMICLHNIDIAYRLFMETHNKALELATELDQNYDLPSTCSKLLQVPMTTPSPDIPVSRIGSIEGLSRVFSNEGFSSDYTVTSSIVMPKMQKFELYM